MEKLTTCVTTPPPANSDAFRYPEPNPSNGESGKYLPIILDGTTSVNTDLPQTINPALLTINMNNETF